MQIVCPSCATSYEVETASVPSTGRHVRCVRCGKVWRAVPPDAKRLPSVAQAIAPDLGALADTATVSVVGPISHPSAPSGPEAIADVAWSELAVDAPSAEGQTVGVPALPWPGADASSPPPSALVDADAPSIAPAELDGPQVIDIGANRFTAHATEPREDIETIAARRHRRHAARASVRWPLSRLLSGMLALFIADVIVLGWRSDIVRVLPQTASFYALFGLPVNLRGLTFENVATSTEQYEGVPILVVEGNIVNNVRKNVDVPKLQFVVRNAVRQEIYSWTAAPARTPLPRGEAAAFRSRLASPPLEAHDVLVRFVNRRDIVAGTR